MGSDKQAWAILAVAFIAQLLAIGTTLFSFGLYIEPLEQEFAASRGTLNSGVLMMLIGSAVFSIIVGRLLDRFEARYIMVLGTFSLALGLIGIANSDSLRWSALLIAGPVSLGLAAIGPLCASTLVTNWFSVNRGLAMGISTISTSVGGIIVTPFTALLISDYGWRQALTVEAMIIVVVLAPLAFFIVRSRPEQATEPPHSMDSVDAIKRVAHNIEKGWSLKQLLGDRTYWCIALGIGIVFAINQAFIISLVPYAKDLGISADDAATIVATLAALGILGKLLFGWLAGFISKVILLLATAVVMIAFYIMLLLYQPQYSLLLISCGLLGLFTSGVFPVWASLLGDCYGRKSYGMAMGAMNFLMLPMNLALVYFIGKAYDISGNYEMAFTVFAALLVLAAVLMSLIRLPLANVNTTVHA